MKQALDNELKMHAEYAAHFGCAFMLFWCGRLSITNAVLAFVFNVSAELVTDIGVVLIEWYQGLKDISNVLPPDLGLMMAFSCSCFTAMWILVCITSWIL